MLCEQTDKYRFIRLIYSFQNKCSKGICDWLVSHLCEQEKYGYMGEHMTVHLELNGNDYGTTLVQCGYAQRGEYITDQEMQSQQIQYVFLVGH